MNDKISLEEYELFEASLRFSVPFSTLPDSRKSETPKLNQNAKTEIQKQIMSHDIDKILNDIERLKSQLIAVGVNGATAVLLEAKTNLYDAQEKLLTGG